MNYEKFFDRNCYHVETINGKKYVHIDGYVYNNGDGNMLTQFVGAYISVEELQKTNDRFEDVEDLFKQTCDEVSDKEIETYFRNIKEFPMDMVTEETPNGWYVDKNWLSVAQSLCTDLDNDVNDVAQRLKTYAEENTLTIEEVDDMCWENSSNMFNEIM